MSEELFIKRCFDLAKLGRGHTSPNPIVGAVIVYNGRIIGEGYHQKYGEAHAEVNAVNSVKKEDLPLLRASTLYCSLEPCSIYGNTPPCTDLIIRQQIPKVVLSYLDHTPGVDGLGVEKLRQAGIEVKLNVLPEAGKRLSYPRNTFVKLGRPYVILKYAVSQDGFLAPHDQQGLFWMTNRFSKRLVHKWRSEVDAILVGTNTAAKDRPRLNNRLFYGSSPTRLVLDPKLRLPESLPLFDGTIPTYVYTQRTVERDLPKEVNYVQLKEGKHTLLQILAHLHTLKKVNLMVEGGARILQQFLDLDLWDEIRLFRAPVCLYRGLKAPDLPQGFWGKQWSILEDQLQVIYRSRGFD